MLKIKKNQRYIAVLATSISVVNPKIQEIQDLHLPRQGEVNSNSKLDLHSNPDFNICQNIYKCILSLNNF